MSALLRLGIAAALERLVAPKPTRDPLARRRYARDPWRYFEEILGFTLTPQQGEVLEAVLDHDRVAVLAANNIGKTHLMAALGVWWMDAVGEQVDSAGVPEGARLLLPGPDLTTVRQTIWAQMQLHIDRARVLGHDFAGTFAYGVNQKEFWRNGAGWCAEGLAPPKRTGQGQSHSAAGRHATYMMGLVEEAQGVETPMWASIEGTCSGHGNKVVAACNPYDRRGKIYEITRGKSWKVLHLSSFGHPNIIERRPVIPAAISHHRLEADIMDSCEDLGPADSVVLENQDFVYALPPEDCADDSKPRGDGRGHEGGELRVYRPKGTFAPRRLGQFPLDGSGAGLISGSAWDAAVERWKRGEDPVGVPPDRVGVDASGGKHDESCLAPAWGPTADWLIEEWSRAKQAGNSERVRQLREDHRIRIGQIEVLDLGPGRGPEIAAEATAKYPASYLMIEDVGDGRSVVDHAKGMCGHSKVEGINLQGAGPPRVEGEQLSGNMRAAMFVRFSMLVTRGLIDLPPDPRLREEAMAAELEYKAGRTGDDGVHRSLAYAIPKKRMTKDLGRSPDRFDSAWLACCAPEPEDEDDYWIS